LGNASFAEKYRRARRDLIEHVSTLLQTSAGSAAQTLNEIAGNVDNPASARVSAARCVLEFAFSSFEQNEILQRIERLENLERGLRALR